MKNIGKFITFEGGEGGGKSTQCKLLKEAFNNRNIDVTLTREPGGTKGAEQIRKLLVTGDIDKWDSITETLLHLAARQDHVRNLIKPSLESGKFVICDRFSDSTIAYQGYAHGLGLEKIESLQKQILGDFSPALTFILDISIKDGIARAAKRGNTENRYEKMGKEFHSNVRKGFLEIAKKEPERCFVINANDSVEIIHKKIIEIINKKLSLYLKEAIA
ncbi:MAG: dTMP kinase [Alphaproteobacteria bacterium CG11_big_fil_rev_8_21_14_0_20_39_49]|nr:MAG: dTMP kinase [Alphaproteobacteria bacterium CG11_big_fil_rev_8_21_14_0_20_39_49]